MSPSSSASGYHAYEVIISYQAVVDAGVKAPLNATELSSFQEKVYRGEPPRYRCHLGCILLEMAAISLLTGADAQRLRHSAGVRCADGGW